MDPLRRPNDGHVQSAPLRPAIGFEQDRITLAGGIALPLSKDDGFEEGRIAALLSAAYGRDLPSSAIAYVKGAVEKQREGQTPLALTYLALAGLPSLADAEAAAWRLSAADELMKAGVAPATIIEALRSSVGNIERAYDPNQPRVPAGNGVVSGQWTKEDDGEGAEGSRGSASPIIHVTDNSPNWAQHSNPTGTAPATWPGHATANNPGSSRPGGVLPVVLPNGQKISTDEEVPFLMSPVARPEPGRRGWSSGGRYLPRPPCRSRRFWRRDPVPLLKSRGLRRPRWDLRLSAAG